MFREGKIQGDVVKKKARGRKEGTKGVKTWEGGGTKDEEKPGKQDCHQQTQKVEQDSNAGASKFTN